MKKLLITNIQNFTYEVEDHLKNSYHLTLSFQNANYNPQINDILYLSETTFKDKDMLLTFGPLYSIYGKDLTADNYDDILIIDNQKERIYLQRYYG